MNSCQLKYTQCYKLREITQLYKWKENSLNATLNMSRIVLFKLQSNHQKAISMAVNKW